MTKFVRLNPNKPDIPLRSCGVARRWWLTNPTNRYDARRKEIAMFGIDLRKLLLGVFSAGLLPLGCFSGGCMVTIDGIHARGGLGPAGSPVVTLRVDAGPLVAALDVPEYAEIPPGDDPPDG
jgi:hypothetical protein